MIYVLSLTFHCSFYFPLRQEDKFLKNQVFLSSLRQQIFSLKLPAEALWTFPCKPKTLETELGGIYKGGEMKGIAVWRKSSRSAVK